MPFTPTNVVNGTTAVNATWGNFVQTQYAEATNSFQPNLFTSFVLSGLYASKDATTATKLNVTAGTAAIPQADSTLRERSIAASSQTTVTINTTYYLFLNNDGTFTWGTTSTPPANSLAICQVTTDGSGNILTVTDKRVLTTGLLPSGTLVPVVGGEQMAASVTPSQAGTVSGGVTFGGAAAIAGDSGAGSASFNGTSGYVNLPLTGLPTGTSAWSMEAWVKIAANPAANSFVAAFGANGTKSDPLLYINPTGQPVADVDGGSATGTALTLNAWHHLVATYDGTTVRIWQDGTNSGSLAVTGTNIGAVYAHIGAWGAASTGAPQSFFNGSLAEVAIYTTALSSARVSAHFTAGTAGGYKAAVVTDSPTVYYRLGEPAGALYANSSIASTLQTLDAAGASTLGRVASVGGQASVGALGVPLIVAQVIQYHLTVTTSQTILSFTPPADGTYRATLTWSLNNGTTNAPTSSIVWTDAALGTGFGNPFVTTSNLTPLDGAHNISAPVALAIMPVTVYAKAGTAITISVRDPSGTPNDFLTAILERLS